MSNCVTSSELQDYNYADSVMGINLVGGANSIGKMHSLIL
jgi:hypothetical protein